MSEKTLFKKLLEVQKEVGAISKDSANTHFKYKYFDINKLIKTPSLATQDWLPSLPAVAIFNNSELAYFGPYSSGSICGPSNSFVELVMGMLNRGKKPALINSLEKGCYCENTVAAKH